MNDLVNFSESINNDEFRNSVHKILGELLINVVNKYFSNQTVIVDGYRFINCIFDNCELIIYRGTFELHNCKLNIKMYRYSEESQKIIQLLMLSGVCNGCDKMSIYAFLKPKINTDGTISIGKGVSC
jgi:hypothetical protein